MVKVGIEYTVDDYRGTFVTNLLIMSFQKCRGLTLLHFRAFSIADG